MKSFKLDKDGDLLIVNNELQMTDNYLDELMQSIWVTLSTNINEWFLNTKFGLDYDIFMNNPTNNLALIEAGVGYAIKQDERIENIEYINVEFNKEKRYVIVNVGIVDYNKEFVEIREVIRID